MTGRKTLGEVRAELEAALGVGPAGEGAVAESLRRFLAAGAGESDAPNPAPQQASAASQVSETSSSPRTAGAAEPGR